MDCFLKIHSRPPNTVIGVCDKELIGKKLKKDQYCFQVTETFFKDQLVTIEQAVELLKSCPNFNVVGEKIITALINHKIIHPDGILHIDGVPIALRFLF